MTPKMFIKCVNMRGLKSSKTRADGPEGHRPTEGGSEVETISPA